MAKKPNAPALIEVPAPVAPIVVEVVEVPKPEPVFVADAGAALFVDRAGGKINVGLTEGADNFATITAHARSVLPQE